MPKVALVMSTYNGEKFLEKQLESLFQQEGVELTIYVRDDLSTDSTFTILKKNSDRLIIIDNKDTNLGVGNSFMEALYFVGTNYDYYAFCDQDDIWLPDKLSRGISFLNHPEKPQLYNSNQELVDDKLNSLGLRHNQSLDVSPLQILTNNKITGCTMVWNKKLQELLLDPQRRPSSEVLKVRIQDVWVSMVASLVGDVFYDPESRIKYRQHDNNVVGVRVESRASLWKKKIFNSEKQQGRSKLAIAILQGYNDLLKKPDLEMISVYANYSRDLKSKWRLLSDKMLSAKSTEPRYQFIIKVLLNLV